MVVNYRKIIAPVYYSLVIVVTEPQAGTVSGMGKYLMGTEVTVTAETAQRGVFQGWYLNGQLVSSDKSYTLVIDSDLLLTAKFAMQCEVSAAVSPEGAGTVSGGGTYLSGETATLTAASGEGYLFTGWINAAGEVVSESPEYSFQVTGDTTLTAQFAVLYTVTILPSIEDAGTVTGGGSYPYGTEITVTAEKNAGYTFNGWLDASGNLIATDTSYTFTVTENITLTASFEVKASRLPEGYTEVEYIESNGTQYINTNQGTSNIKVIMDVQPLSGGGERQAYFGEAGGYYVSSQFKYNFFIMWHNNTGNNVSVNYSANSSKPTAYLTKVNTYEDGKKIIVTLDGKNKVASVGGDSKTISYNRGSNGTIYLLANCITAQYTESDRWPMTARLFSCQVYYNATRLVRDFVPCINPTGAVGLYDLVGNTFYGNVGTGEFSPGPAV